MAGPGGPCPKAAGDRGAVSSSLMAMWMAWAAGACPKPDLGFAMRSLGAQAQPCTVAMSARPAPKPKVRKPVTFQCEVAWVVRSADDSVLPYFCVSAEQPAGLTGAGRPASSGAKRCRRFVADADVDAAGPAVRHADEQPRSWPFFGPICKLLIRVRRSFTGPRSRGSRMPSRSRSPRPSGTLRRSAPAAASGSTGSATSRLFDVPCTVANGPVVAGSYGWIRHASGQRATNRCRHYEKDRQPGQ